MLRSNGVHFMAFVAMRRDVGMGTPKDSPEVLARFNEALPAIKPIALRLRRTLGRAAEIDDLMSYGQGGLLEAARRFDPARGVPFRAFANFRIRGAMLD